MKTGSFTSTTSHQTERSVHHKVVSSYIFFPVLEKLTKPWSLKVFSSPIFVMTTVPNNPLQNLPFSCPNTSNHRSICSYLQTCILFHFPMNQIKSPIFPATQSSTKSILSIQIFCCASWWLWWGEHKYSTHLTAALPNVQVLLLIFLWPLLSLYYWLQMNLQLLQKIFLGSNTSIFYVKAPETAHFSTVLCTVFISS